MSTAYQIEVLAPTGERRAIIADWTRLELARRVNDVGALEIGLPGHYRRDDFPRDTRLLVRRSVEGGPMQLVGETAWLVTGMARAQTATGIATTLKAQDAVALVGRRIVAYPAGSAQASQEGALDDLVKRVARQNWGALAATERQWAQLAIEAERGAAPTRKRSFSWDNLLPAFQAFAENAYALGTYLAFDVVATEGGGLELRTYTGQRGQDRRWPTGTRPLLLSAETGTLAEASLEEDASEEATFVYAAGQGEGAARVVATASNPARMVVSPFGRIEHFQDARNEASPAQVQARAEQALAERSVRRAFSGRLVDQPGLRFGVDYGYGDHVTAQFDGEVIDARLDVLHITVAEGRETVDVRLEGAPRSSGCDPALRLLSGVRRELRAAGRQERPPPMNPMATTAPGVGDDEADGYGPGSIWVDVAAGVAWVCVDATAGDALWKQVT